MNEKTWPTCSEPLTVGGGVSIEIHLGARRACDRSGRRRSLPSAASTWLRGLRARGFSGSRRRAGSSSSAASTTRRQRHPTTSATALIRSISSRTSCSRDLRHDLADRCRGPPDRRGVRGLGARHRPRKHRSPHREAASPARPAPWTTAARPARRRAAPRRRRRAPAAPAGRAAAGRWRRARRSQVTSGGGRRLRRGWRPAPVEGAGATTAVARRGLGLERRVIRARVKRREPCGLDLRSRRLAGRRLE
mgnify:CR=1 FL=1